LSLSNAFTFSKASLVNKCAGGVSPKKQSKTIKNQTKQSFLYVFCFIPIF
jgi:hypothetical protein